MNQLVVEEIQKKVFEFIKNGVVYVDRQGVVVQINNRACQLMKTEKKDAIGKHIFELCPTSKLMAVMESQLTLSDETIDIFDNKCLTTRAPIVVEDEVVGALAVFDDITLYESLNKAWEEDKSEKTILKTILELAYDGILVVDKQGYITMISDSYRIFLGFEDQNVIGKHCTEVVENTRMHIVAKTGIPEINDVQELKGNYIVATRFPYYENGELAGVIGKVLFRNTSELDEINKKFYMIEQELNSYKSELVDNHKTKYNLEHIVTQNNRMQSLKADVKKIARSSSNVTLIGESGTGKELFAHAIHMNSPRNKSPFVKVNCAAIPENLLEAELFGYEKGSFTGANASKMGKFEIADGGTLFLDEIGDMPLKMQAKILRTLQEGEVERIGSNKTKFVDVRIIAATNKDLKAMIKEKTFREDLYYRINVLNLFIPPLRERKEDIVIICHDFIDYLNRTCHKNITGLSSKAMAILLSYDWPGNVRELRNILERAYSMLEAEFIIEPWHLPAHLKSKQMQGRNIPLKSAIAEVEKKIIIDRLIAFNGNKTKTAENLGISRMALHKKIEKFGLK